MRRKTDPPPLTGLEREWLGKRVSFQLGPDPMAGLVLGLSIQHDDEGAWVALRVLRDDGFIEPGVRAEWAVLL